MSGAEAQTSRTLYVALVVGGLLLGLVIGRWWTLVAPVALGAWIGVTEEVEVPGAFLGIGYALFSAAGVVAGVLLRRPLAK